MAQLLSFDPPFGIENFLVALDCIASFIFNVGVVLGVVMILVSAALFLFSGGSPERVTTAKRALLWAVIGIIAAILVKSIMVVVLDFFFVEGATLPQCPGLL